MSEPDVAARLAAGQVTFMGIELLVAPGALVPRADSELLGKTAVRLLAEKRPLRLIDMCCGSGNLACGMASALGDAEIWACDLTEATVTLALKNVERLGLGSRVHVRRGDLFAALAEEDLGGTIAGVICNPPYISTGRLGKERAELLAHEPREAFDAGPYGLSIHQRLVREAPAFLASRGLLLFQFGLGQERQVVALLERAGQYIDIELVKNENGEPRVVIARKRQ